MFMYFLKKRLERELIRQGITPEGWTSERLPPGPGEGASGGPKVAFKREPRRKVQRPQRARLTGRHAPAQAPPTVFKAGAQRQESEFEQRLAEAVRQRKARGQWHNV